ncbi:MAG: hypothetical protein BHW60_08080 [Sutterella sp. 54_7]|nr:MAG: hypothetical protein BHW60_08080 [Sutterella sp. 54_7]
MLKQSLWALAAALFFSMMAACVKLTNGELTTLEMVFYRSLFGVITIGLFVKRNHLSLKTPHLMGNITRSILGTLSISVWFFTLGQLPFGTNMTLVYTTPLFMSVNFIILALLRHQRAPWGLAAAIIAGFSGITIILQPSFSSDQLWPALLTLSVALLDLAIYWQMKELGRLQEPSWRIVFYFTCFGHMPSPEAALAVLAMGAFATLGQIATTRSYAYGNMLLSSCLGFSAIPFAAIISWLLFDEPSTLMSICGMLLITTAGIGATIITKRAEARGIAPVEGKVAAEGSKE